ncbi:biotin/lipoyl-containing protein, partial [Streptomyces sp. NPDC002766]|uniref:biotin/lipoyl-containing protein n=1 Tax=Streptomyces sp. NPDC002766 TaxID=3154429 RepID=UPI0033212950
MDDLIVQHGTVNTLRLGQWLATFDTPLVLRPGQAVRTLPPGGGRSATAIYSTILTSAQPVNLNSQAGRQLTKRIQVARSLLEQVAVEEPIGCDPSDWPLSTAPSWRTASTLTQPSADQSDPDNTVVRMPNLGDADQEVAVTRWLKAVGDSVEADEPLLETSSAEGDTEIPSPASGTLLEITASEDSSVIEGDTLAVIGPALTAPQVNVEYQFTLVSLTRRASGKPWWDDILLSDPNWFIPGRTAGGLLPSPAQGTANTLPYALLLVRNVVVDTPDQPPADTMNLGPVRVEDASGTLGWSGMQAIGLLANVLPTLPPAADPAVPPPPSAHFQP